MSAPKKWTARLMDWVFPWRVEELERATSEMYKAQQAAKAFQCEAAEHAADARRLTWLSERMIELDWTMATGCRCGGCEVFKIMSYGDNLDDIVLVEADTLREAIDKAEAKTVLAATHESDVRGKDLSIPSTP